MFLWLRDKLIGMYIFVYISFISFIFTFVVCLYSSVAEVCCIDQDASQTCDSLFPWNCKHVPPCPDAFFCNYGNKLGLLKFCLIVYVFELDDCTVAIQY